MSNDLPHVHPELAGFNLAMDITTGKAIYQGGYTIDDINAFLTRHLYDKKLKNIHASDYVPLSRKQKPLYHRLIPAWKGFTQLKLFV